MRTTWATYEVLRALDDESLSTQPPVPTLTYSECRRDAGFPLVEPVLLKRSNEGCTSSFLPGCPTVSDLQTDTRARADTVADLLRSPPEAYGWPPRLELIPSSPAALRNQRRLDEKRDAIRTRLGMIRRIESATGVEDLGDEEIGIRAETIRELLQPED